MAAWAWSRNLSLESWAGAYVIGFASHAILDRHTHPYINYFSGWVEPGDPHTEQFRSMHPFLERLVDVAMLQSQRSIHPNDLDFYGLVNVAQTPSSEWIDMMASSLAGSYKVAEGDEEIRERLNSAYLDTMGYYRFTNFVDESYIRQGVSRERSGEIGRRWLSIIHPLELPENVDVLNVANGEWTHPCDENERHHESFHDLFDAATEETVNVVQEIAGAWSDTEQDIEVRRVRIEEAVGNWNLSDGRRTNRPCRKTHANPLPLQEIQERIRGTVPTDGTESA